MSAEDTIEIKNTTSNNEVDKQQGFKAYVIRQYKKNKIALVSLYFIFALIAIALFADFIANEKPLVAKYKDNVYFPVFREYTVDLGLSEWPSDLQNIEWAELDYDFAIWPPVPYLPQNLDFSNAQSVGPFDEQRIKSLHWRHWLGTDELGRDILSGMIHGTRIALLVGVISMGIASFIGIILGALAGFLGDDRIKISRARILMCILGIFLGSFYAFGARSYILADAIAQSFGSLLVELFISLLIFALIMFIFNVLVRPLKKIPYLGEKRNLPVDMIISRTIEIIVSVPSLFLIISIVAIAKPSIFLVMTVIGATSWTGIARFIRAELLRVRNLEYIEAATALGFNNFRILMRHAIPNALSPVLIAIAFGIASSILVESILSFLGIGVPADTVTWGSLLSAARRSAQAWWLAVFPGFAIFITVTVFNLVGEGLTDALDPRKKR